MRLVNIPLYLEKKEELKNIALKIKDTRKEHKERQRSGKDCLGYKLHNLKHEFRCLHIALSLFRGKSLEQIENPKEHNEPRHYVYKKILEKLNEAKADVAESALCSNEIRPE